MTPDTASARPDASRIGRIVPGYTVPVVDERAVRGQRPEWVGAPQKVFAWWLGFALALISCASMGLFAAPLWLTLALCSVCLVLLFLETAFGICVGCALQARFSKDAPMYCPGGSCETRSA